VATKVRLILGDCLAEIKKLRRSIDAVVSDPPYGIGYVKGPGGNPRAGRSWCRRNHSKPVIGDDQPFDPAPLLAIAPHVILWGANHYASRLPHGSWVAWDKLDGREPWDSFSDVEFAWCNWRGKDRIVRHLWKGVCTASEVGKRRLHPTQKPVAVMRWCLEQLPASSLTILDPYMGSGSTGVAAVEMGLNFIGIERDPAYFKIARERIASARGDG
jgi:site-specific DNA-methyltransferase (adenine-specific)/modification methylase